MIRKVCAACGVEKRLGDFYRNRLAKDGHEGKCKACRRAYMSEYREANAEAAREQQRRRYATDPEYRAHKLAYVREYVKTERGRESRRITQRIYRAFQRAQA